MRDYSRTGDPTEELRELMNTVSDDRAREEIRKVVERMEQM